MFVSGESEELEILEYFVKKITIILIPFLLTQASSEHPIGKSIVAYARHFHFFDESPETSSDGKELNSGWLFDVSNFSALPGRGIQCFIDGKRILVKSSLSF